MQVAVEPKLDAGAYSASAGQTLSKSDVWFDKIPQGLLSQLRKHEVSRTTPRQELQQQCWNKGRDESLAPVLIGDVEPTVGRSGWRGVD